MNELSSWLAVLRKESKLSLAQLSEKTKIIARHLEALEKGDFAALPTAVHGRAFALAFARACGADEEEALEKVASGFPVAAVKNETSVDAPRVPGRFGRKPQDIAKPEPEPVAPAEAAPEPEEASSPLPWKLWSLVAAASLAFLFLIHGTVSWVRSSTAPKPEAVPAAAEPVSSTASIAEAPADELALRSRRPCWVLLVIDGKRLPVIFLEPDKRERFLVKQKAVMLAGNIGAVRVWWRNDNLGYFGELGDRMNGIVFENGKPWRKDPSEDLALPPGVPSKPQVSR